MDISKIVDDIFIPLKFKESDKTRFCFIVFSSKEKHIEIPIDCIERVFNEEEYDVRRLDSSLKSEDSQYSELIDLLKQCSFAVVIMDGLRPNVVFEYGILKGLGKPCIVLLEENAEVDVINYFKKDNKIKNPKINMNNNFSDIKDRFYIKYNKNLPKETVDLIKKEYSKLKKEIDSEFIRMIFPEKEIVEKELKEEINKLLIISKKKKDQLNSVDESELILSINKIEEAVNRYKIALPKYYYNIITNLLLNFKKYDYALEILNKEIKNKKEDLTLLLLKSYILFITKKYRKALETINITVKLKPKLEIVWHRKGLILDKMGRKKEAKLCYKKGIDLDQKCHTIHLLYGLLLYEERKYKEALEQFEKALKIKSTDENILIWKSITLDKLGKNKEAIKIAEEAVCINDNNPGAWFNLGRLLKDPEESMECFDKAISIKPDHTGALCSKAADLSNIGKVKESLEIFEKIKTMCSMYNSCNLVMLNIAATLFKNKQFKSAIKYVNKTIKLDINKNEKIKALSLKAEILHELKKDDESLKIFDEILKLDPKNANAFYNKSCVFACLNKINDAIKLLKIAIKLDSSYKEIMKKDKDFDKIRKNIKFKKEFG